MYISHTEALVIRCPYIHGAYQSVAYTFYSWKFLKTISNYSILYGTVEIWAYMYAQFLFLIYVCSTIFTAWLVWMIKEEFFLFLFFDLNLMRFSISLCKLGNGEGVGWGCILRWVSITVLFHSLSGMLCLCIVQSRDSNWSLLCHSKAAHANDQILPSLFSSFQGICLSFY